MTRITRLSIMKVTRTTRFVLLYYTDIDTLSHTNFSNVLIFYTKAPS